MIDKVFNSKDIPFEHAKDGKTKILLNKDFLGSSKISKFILNPNSEFETHEHDYTQVMYFISCGEGEVILDEEREYPIEKGLIVVVQPRQCHKVINRSDKPVEILVFESYTKIVDSTPFLDF